MILSQTRLKEIESLFIMARPYFKKDIVSEELIINLNSSERDLDKAKFYITSHLHLDRLKDRTDISENDKKEKIKFYNDVVRAIEDLKAHRKELELEAEQERIQEIVTTIQECIDNDKAVLSTNDTTRKVNYFTLFGFNQKKSNEYILKSDRFQKLKNALKPEHVGLIAGRYQEQTKYLVKHFEDFQKVLSSKEARASYEQMLKDSYASSIQRIKNTIANVIINYKKVRGSIKIDYFKLFSISMKLNNMEIKSSRQFADLRDAFILENAGLVEIMDRELFEELIAHFRTFEYKVLSSKEERQDYEESLKTIGKVDGEIALLKELIAKCESLPKGQFVNFYDLFGFNATMSSEDIAATDRYKVLVANLTQKGVSKVEPSKVGVFQTLIAQFNEFKTKVIENKIGREFYDKLVEQAIVQSKPVAPAPKKPGTVNPLHAATPADDVKTMITEYKKAMASDELINYYELFNVESGLSVKDILESSRMVELSSMLQVDKFASYGLDETLKNAFKSLCRTFDSFKTWTLSSIENKVDYDMSLGLVKAPVGTPTKKSEPTQPKSTPTEPKTTGYKYEFIEMPIELDYEEDEVLVPFEKAIEYGVKTHGAAKTVSMLTKFVKTGSIAHLDEEMQNILKDFKEDEKLGALYETLPYVYGSTTDLESVEYAVNVFFSNRPALLKEIMGITLGEQSEVSSIRRKGI